MSCKLVDRLVTTKLRIAAARIASTLPRRFDGCAVCLRTPPRRRTPRDVAAVLKGLRGASPCPHNKSTLSVKSLMRPGAAKCGQTCCNVAKFGSSRSGTRIQRCGCAPESHSARTMLFWAAEPWRSLSNHKTQWICIAAHLVIVQSVHTTKAVGSWRNRQIPTPSDVFDFDGLLTCRPILGPPA